MKIFLSLFFIFATVVSGIANTQDLYYKNGKCLESNTLENFYFWNKDFDLYGPVPSDSDIKIVKINNSGRIAGNHMGNRAFVWDKDFGFLDLGHLYSGKEGFTQVIDMNESGQIIGISNFGDHQRIIFLWEDGIIRDVSEDFYNNPEVKGFCRKTSIRSLPILINENGEILISIMQMTERGCIYPSPFLWKNGEVKEILKNTPPPGMYALDMNEEGIILYIKRGPWGRHHLFKFNPSNEEEIFIREVTEDYFRYY